MGIKYLKDDKMMMSAGELVAHIVSFQTGEGVLIPDNAFFNGFANVQNNMDPYASSGGRLTAGDGFRAPGMNITAIA